MAGAHLSGDDDDDDDDDIDMEATSHRRRTRMRMHTHTPPAQAHDDGQLMYAVYVERLSQLPQPDLDTLLHALEVLHDVPLHLGTLKRACAELLRSRQSLTTTTTSTTTPTTPTTPTTTPHSSASALNLVPSLPSPTPQRAIQIAAEASAILGRDAWRTLLRNCRTVRRSLRSDDPDDLRDDLVTFLFAVLALKADIARKFDRIAACDLTPHSIDAYYLAPVKHAFAKVSAWRPEPTDDQVLAYVLFKFPPPPHRHDAAAAVDTAALEDLRVQLETSMRRTYRGDAHHRLLRFAIKVNRSLTHAATGTPAPYWKGTPVVQSSGTGKTRLVLQLGNIAPLLFVCIRQPGSRSDQGYPLADDDAVRFLQLTAHADRNDNVIAAAFLAAWFDVLAEHLETQTSAERKHKILLDLNAYGIRHQEDTRKHFFRRVAASAEECVAQAPPPHAARTYHDLFATLLNPPVERLSKQLRPVQSYLATKFKNPDTTALGGDVELPHIFVAIDECVNLGAKLLESFRRAWNHIGTLEAHNHAVWWLLLTSTNSGAADLVRPSKDASSSREVSIPSMPTFFAVGFDTLRAEQPVLQRPIDATEPGYIVLFGRPMWATLHPRNFWATAVAKLIGGKFVNGDRDMCFSIVASRLALRYVPLRGTGTQVFLDQNSFTQKAVDRHMRLLSGVHADTALQISSPSEPVLALAAALVMLPTAAEERRQGQAVWGLAKNRYGSILQTFKDMCSDSQTVDVFKGTRGELVARLLWMAASDAALVADTLIVAEAHRVTQDHRTPEQDLRARVTRHLQPVAVDVLLAKLIQLGADDQAQVQRRIDEVCSHVSHLAGDRAGDQAGDQASAAQAEVRAWTHFSHFDVLEEAIDEISPEFLWYCWKRGVAVQLAHSQHGIDGLIPVFVGHLARPFGQAAAGHADEARQAARHMTYVAWEAKNRSKTYASLAQRAAASDKHAGPAIRSDGAGDGKPLTQRGLLTVLTDVGAAYAQTSVTPIGATGALQIWIRGTDDARVYPCLDELGIRDVVVAFVVHLSQLSPAHIDYESENTLPNPMHLDHAIVEPEPGLEPDHGPPDAHEAMNVG